MGSACHQTLPILQSWPLAKGLRIESFLLEGNVLEHGEKSYVVSFCNCPLEMQLATVGWRGISSKKHDGKGAQDHVGPSTTCRLRLSSLSWIGNFYLRIQNVWVTWRTSTSVSFKGFNLKMLPRMNLTENVQAPWKTLKYYEWPRRRLEQMER